MTDRIIIKTEQKVEPNLRKLARALIALAELRLAADQKQDDQQPAKAVTTNTGDAA